MNSKNALRLVITIAGSLVLAGCTSTPARSFADADLLIDKSVMPDGWAVADYAKKNTEPEGQDSSAYITFYLVGTTYFIRGGEDVYRYSSSDKASWHYNRFEAAQFDDATVDRTTPWKMPTNFNFASPTATKWRFACAGSNFTLGLDTGKTRTLCNYLAQYDEFLISFGVTTEIDGHSFITLDQITQVIEAIDQKMTDHLKPKSPPTSVGLDRTGEPTNGYERTADIGP